jgi:DNA-binding CsgD family transcriptional regulator
MSEQENRIGEPPCSGWIEDSAPIRDDPEAVLSGARAQAAEEGAVEFARQLNGPMTALLLYMSEIKQHSHQLSGGNRAYLHQVVENALEQTERVCAIIKQMTSCPENPADLSGRKAGSATEGGRGKDRKRSPAVMLSSASDQKPLTKREREVLSIVREGYSNKEGALRLNISPRTFESHRAEAMRKLGARNTADLVRLAILHPAL